MDNYKLIIETVTTETGHDWEDDDGSDSWAALFEKNLGKFLLTEYWMIGEETVGDCQTLMNEHYRPIFWDSVEEAISYIISEYHTNTKAVQEVVLISICERTGLAKNNSIYKVRLGSPDISEMWAKNFAQLEEK